MARRVIWTDNSIEDFKSILEFWIEHNRSGTFSRKLRREVEDALDLLKTQPEIGRITTQPGIRGKLVRQYWLFYEADESQPVVHRVTDARVDPNKIEKMLGDL